MFRQRKCCPLSPLREAKHSTARKAEQRAPSTTPGPNSPESPATPHCRKGLGMMSPRKSWEAESTKTRGRGVPLTSTAASVNSGRWSFRRAGSFFRDLRSASSKPSSDRRLTSREEPQCGGYGSSWCGGSGGSSQLSSSIPLHSGKRASAFRTRPVSGGSEDAVEVSSTGLQRVVSDVTSSGREEGLLTSSRSPRNRPPAPGRENSSSSWEACGQGRQKCSYSEVTVPTRYESNKCRCRRRNGCFLLFIPQ